MPENVPGDVGLELYRTDWPSRSRALRFIDSDGDLAELIKRSASDRLGDVVPLSMV